MRILVLTHPELVPPTKIFQKDLVGAKWRTDYDVIRTLKKLDHDVLVLGVWNDLKKIKEALDIFKPDITYNLLDEFNGQATLDQNVVSFLELLDIPYTGCSPKGLILSRDKVLTKKILSFHGILVPDFRVVPLNKSTTSCKDLRFPLIVKSRTEEASLGISQFSVVYNFKDLKKRIRFIHQKIKTDALVESYIEGRELYVGMLGNETCKVLPIWEMVFGRMPSSAPRIATQKLKWNPNFQKKYGITTRRAKNLNTKLQKRISATCKLAYEILNLNGYARMDLRLTPQNEIYFLEANPNPDIGSQEDFAQSAMGGGIKYPALLSQILDLGLSRSV